MKPSYRTRKNAQAISSIWGRPIDDKTPYKIEALSDDDVEIFIFDILGWPFNDINAMIRDLAGIKAKNIMIRLNSPGGDMLDSFALYQALKAHPSNVTVRIEALAASAASIVALSGNEVQAYSTSFFMIHEPWALMAGNQYDLRETADILEKISGNMIDIYSANSKSGKRDIAQMMKDETWLTAKEAQEKGFVDVVLRDQKGNTKATFDLSMFNHAPDELAAATGGSHHEPTEREIEKLLRDGGVSNRKAKAILAGCRKVEAEAEQSGQMETIRNSLDGLLATIQAAA